MTTLLINGRAASIAGANGWLPVPELERLSGWELKPEGACLGERCVPLPPGREAEFVRDGHFNILRLADYLGQPVIRDHTNDLIAVGESGEGRAGRLRSLQAPHFTLPDLSGWAHSLRDYRGRKVFLASWASW